MIKAFNSGSDNGVGVFPDLAVKAGVAYGRLRLLVKPGVFASVKELRRNGDRAHLIPADQGSFNFVRLCGCGHATIPRLQSDIARDKRLMQLTKQAERAFNANA